MNFIKAVIGGAWVSLASATVVAAPIIDQSTLLLSTPEGSYVRASAIGNNAGANPPNRVQAQTVTAGLSGRLTRVDLQLVRYAATNNAPILLSVFDGSRIDPDVRLVGTVTIAGDQVPLDTEFASKPFISVDLATMMFEVEAGDVFTLQLSTGASTGLGYSAHFVYGWESAELDENYTPLDSFYLNYAGGTNYLSERGGPFQATAFDRGFRTFVDPVDVPEPAAVELLGLAVIGLAFGRRRADGGRPPG